MMKITRRSATNADAEAIINLISRVLSEYGLPFYLDTSDGELLDISGNYLESRGIFQILESSDGKIVGSVALRRVSDSSCELRRMYLASEIRGKGIGRFLLAYALDQAKALGYSRVVLETSSPMAEAIGLYKKFGFQPIPPSFSNDSCDLAFALDLKKLTSPTTLENPVWYPEIGKANSNHFIDAEANSP